MYTLGINAVYHDSSACLVRDGQVIVAAEEERFTMTIDGRGEKATTTYNIGEGNTLQRLGQVNFPHSLGLLYERVTDYRGFLRRMGIPVLINTSFNTHSEPIVCIPRDAIECFWTFPLDTLVIGSFLLEKSRDSQ